VAAAVTVSFPAELFDRMRNDELDLEAVANGVHTARWLAKPCAAGNECGAGRYTIG